MHCARNRRLRLAHRGARARPTLGLLALLAGSACSDRQDATVGPEITPNLMSTIVTGRAAANLDGNGRFRLKGPPESGARQLAEREAKALAELWPEQFGAWIRPALEREHGGSIEFALLKVCGRPLYAESPFEPFDSDIITDPMAAVAQRVFGPWWLFNLCNASDIPQVSLAVSAYSTDLTIKDGRLDGPVLGGEWFSAEGIPLGAADEFILSPERSAERVASQSKRRIRDVPRLIIPLRREGFPNHPYWMLELEESVSVQSKAGHLREENRLYIGRRPTGHSNTLAVAALDQPAELPISYPSNIRVGAPKGPREYRVVRARRRVELPISYEPVTLPAR